MFAQPRTKGSASIVHRGRRMTLNIDGTRIVLSFIYFLAARVFFHVFIDSVDFYLAVGRSGTRDTDNDVAEVPFIAVNAQRFVRCHKSLIIHTYFFCFVTAVVLSVPQQRYTLSCTFLPLSTQDDDGCVRGLQLIVLLVCLTNILIFIVFASCVHASGVK